MSAVTITVRRAFMLEGKAQAVGSTLTVSRHLAAELVAGGKAQIVQDAQPAQQAPGPLTTDNTLEVVAALPARTRRKETEK